MNDFIRKNKVYIIVIGILVIYLVVFRVVSLTLNEENSKYASIIVDGVNIWEYKESNWNIVSEEDFKKQGEQVFDLYSSLEHFGDYTVKVNNRKLYAFDKNYKSLQYSDSILAINSNYDINVYFFDYSTINQNDQNILTGFINNSYVNEVKKVCLDVDNDDVEECFYVINYYDNQEILFSEIYYYDGSLRKIIEDDGSRYSYYDIAYILDIDNDEYYELILSSSYFGNTSYKIYKLKRNDYKLFLE